MEKHPGRAGCYTLSPSAKWTGIEREDTKPHIRSLRMFADAMDLFHCEPHMEFLGWHWRNRNEVYCVANPGQEYGLFFTDGGMATLNVSAAGAGELTVRWLDIMASKWLEPVGITPEKSQIRLLTPDDGYWVAVIRKSIDQ